MDLERGIVTVRATRQRQPGAGLVDRPPKTPSSRRAVPCGSYGVTVLERARARQAVIRIDDELVFEGVTDVTPRRVLWRLPEEEGLPRIRVHDLRHTWASLFAHWGSADPKMASAHLGHSGIAVTAGTYTHVPPALQLEAIQDFQRWLLAQSGAQMAHSE